jgi:hypothetical protein
MTNKFKNWKIFFFRVLTFSDFSKIKFFFLSSTINLLLSVSYTQLCHEWKRPTCPPPPPPPPCHVPVLFQGLFCFFHGIFGWLNWFGQLNLLAFLFLHFSLSLSHLLSFFFKSLALIEFIFYKSIK